MNNLGQDSLPRNLENQENHVDFTSEARLTSS